MTVKNKSHIHKLELSLRRLFVIHLEMNIKETGCGDFAFESILMLVFEIVHS